ncbi:MAG: ribulose bisphosphate carboxylase small subunit [Cyanobacteria bacterium REEB459]|nr:ribulose bisphosphate carboxylase small subunit [Cyanobacteria bacterium REEB459]
MTVGTLRVTPTVEPGSTGNPRVLSPLVHPAAEVSGDVKCGPGVAIALGAVVRAEAGANFALGTDTVLQEGATIHGFSQAKVLGDDQRPYTVWLGNQVTLTHKVLVQGPAYLGTGTFIGLRSTVFNARIGAGCVVMMHALVQDVDIPPGKLVPSGSVITRQEQADGLPDVRSSDLALVRELLGHGNFPASLADQAFPPDTKPAVNQPNQLSAMTLQQLSSDMVQRIRQYLAQGFHIGTEHADSRRYRSGVWQTCSPIQASREAEAIQALQTCLTEHAGEYVRMFGIDPKLKQRVAPVTIQRPDGKPVELNGHGSQGSSPQPYRAAAAQGSLSAEVVQHIRHYLAQGYRIGTEHADQRRYRSNVWQTCSPITATREAEVLAALEVCLAEHAGEYVRLFGIDPRVKQRITPLTIQRPDSQPTNGSGSTHQPGSTAVSSRPPSQAAGLASDFTQSVRQLLNQGYQIGAEYADQRRYRSNVWQTCPPITSTREGDVIAALTSCISQHPGEYVRIFGIEPTAKRRSSELIIQRPGTAPSAAAPAGPAAVAASGGYGGNGASSPSLPQDLVQQINQLVNQGYRLSLEHADQRRYHSGAWQTGRALDGSRVSEVLAALASQLQTHRGEYVRLIGIDPKVKRRVLEATIQRP